MKRPQTLLALGLLGCGGAAPSAAAPTTSPLSPQATAAAPAPSPHQAAPVHEWLPHDAPFAELVRAAAALEQQAGRHYDCLLDEQADGYLLGAEIVAAVRPLPTPPEDLNERTKPLSSVDVLSAWGRYGEGAEKLALVSFTVGPPTRDAVVLLVTDRGLLVRGTAKSPLPAQDDLELPQAVSALAAQPQATVFVSAEARTSLRELHRVLGALGAAGRRVVLAVALAEGTTLPRPQLETGRTARCPDGLPETDDPEGSLPREALMAAVAPLAEGGSDCLGRGDARGAAGGSLQVALRIDAAGRVSEACVRRDELSDPGIAACVVEAARSLRFPAPSPAGVVDVELPVVLKPGEIRAQRPACSGS